MSTKYLLFHPNLSTILFRELFWKVSLRQLVTPALPVICDPNGSILGERFHSHKGIHAVVGRVHHLTTPEKQVTEPEKTAKESPPHPGSAGSLIGTTRDEKLSTQAEGLLHSGHLQLCDPLCSATSWQRPCLLPEGNSEKSSQSCLSWPGPTGDSGKPSGEKATQVLVNNVDTSRVFCKHTDGSCRLRTGARLRAAWGRRLASHTGREKDNRLETQS